MPEVRVPGLASAVDAEVRTHDHASAGVPALWQTTHDARAAGGGEMKKRVKKRKIKRRPTKPHKFSVFIIPPKMRLVIGGFFAANDGVDAGNVGGASSRR